MRASKNEDEVGREAVYETTRIHAERKRQRDSDYSRMNVSFHSLQSAR